MDSSRKPDKRVEGNVILSLALLGHVDKQKPCHTEVPLSPRQYEHLFTKLWCLVSSHTYIFYNRAICVIVVMVVPALP